MKRTLERMSIEEEEKEAAGAALPVKQKEEAPQEKMQHQLVQSAVFEAKPDPDPPMQTSDIPGLIFTPEGPIFDLRTIPKPITYHGSMRMDPYPIALAAVKKLSKLVLDGTLWTKSRLFDGTDVLNIRKYELAFPGLIKRPHSRTEASRAFADVKMDAKQLALMMMKENWSELFPSMVLKGATLEVLHGSSSDNPHGSLQRMYKELHVTSPLVPNRQFLFLRSCTQIDESNWLVADVSLQPSIPVRNRVHPHRLPSGCWIRGIAPGLSQVTWVEHLEIEGPSQDHILYKRLIHSGMAFGAQRWVACLERACERLSHEMGTNTLHLGLKGQQVIVAPAPLNEAKKKKFMMQLTHWMVRDFFAKINPTYRNEDHLWTGVVGPDQLKIHVTLTKADVPDPEMEKLVLRAAATFWLPKYSPEFVFEILRDESKRHEWYVPLLLKPLTTVSHFPTGDHPGNNISASLVEGLSSDILILQEASITRSGSFVVWSTIEKEEFDEVTLGLSDPEVHLDVLSGFFISTDGRRPHTTSTGNTSTSNTGGGGSLVTLVLELLAVTSPSLEEAPKSMNFMSQFICQNVHNINALLHKTAVTTPTEN